LTTSVSTTATNAHIAAAFEELADLYELDGAVQYRVIAYRTAAKAVRESSVSVMQLAREGRVTELPGIGKTLEEKLKALDETGDIPAAQRLRSQFPPGVIAMMHLPGFGAKRARRLYDELGIDSLEALRGAAERQELRGLRGFGAKAEEKLLETLAAGADGRPAPRVLLSRALPIAEQVVGALRAHPGADRVEVAGSLRRRADAVKDLDVIATAEDAKGLVETLTGLPIVESVQQSGDVGARVMTHAGLKVDLKVVEPDQFGNVLQHFTGSKAHNVALREMVVRRGLHVSEYGILDDATGETTRCATEEAVYERLGLPWIPPELREGRGELEAAARGELPRLIELGREIKRDLERSHEIVHPGESELRDVYGVIFWQEEGERPLTQRNVTVFADGEVDRSPCGSGTSARLALLHDEGRLAVDESLRHLSIVGSEFVGRVVEETPDGVVTEVEGSAHRTGRHEFELDPRDELAEGFLLR
jgi:DNA polymerase (family X)